VILIFFVTCVCLSVMEFANVMTPLILGQQLHLAPNKQGMLAGLLGATQQTGTLLFILTAGALADLMGRRVMLLWTLIGLFLCLAAYPFASSVALLLGLRFLWGVAFAGYSSAATVTIDIPDSRSRGKFNSLAFLVPWLTASGFILVTSRWPSGFRAAGFSPHEALLWTFGLVALLPLIGAIVTAAFFEDPFGKAARTATSAAGNVKSVLGSLRAVFAHARTNRNYGLILFIGAVARTDTIIIGSFLGLWIVNAGRVGGMDGFVAAKTAGLIAAIRFVTKVIGAPLFGVIYDKVNRAALTLTSLAMMTAAFCFFGFISNAFGVMMMLGAFFLGFAESAEGIAAQAYLADQAPAHLRGSSVGVFSFLGTISLMAINLVGGYLFDKVGFSSPLVMEGALHFIVLVISIWVLRPGRPGAQVAARF
jgi:MFS family permease